MVCCSSEQQHPKELLQLKMMTVVVPCNSLKAERAQSIVVCTNVGGKASPASHKGLGRKERAQCLCLTLCHATQVVGQRALMQLSAP